MSGNTPAPQSTPPANGPTDGQQGGGDGTSNPQAPPAQQQQQQNDQGQPPGADTSQQSNPESTEQSGEQGLENASRDDLVAQIRELRRENAKDRTTAKDTAAQQATDALTQKLGKALGLIKDGDDTPDPDQLTAQLTEQTNTAKQAQLELSVYRAANKQGVDADTLLDSRSFLEKVADLDPTKTADIETAIQDAVKNNPRLQTGQEPPRRSSNPIKGNRNQQLPETPQELAAKIPRRY